MISVVQQRLLAALLLTLAIPVVLAYLYSSIPLQTWLAAALANSAIALLLLLYYRHNLATLLWQRHAYWLYLPSLAVLVFCGLAILISSYYSSPLRGEVAAHQYLWLSWIPIVEEIVFRFGIGNWLRRWAGNFWGSYCSALCFALAHTLPLWERISTGAIGIPVGVLLLGGICEFLYVRGKSLMPCIVFHAVCNSTVPLFIYFDQRWFAWLQMLFQTSGVAS